MEIWKRPDGSMALQFEPGPFVVLTRVQWDALLRAIQKAKETTP